MPDNETSSAIQQFGQLQQQYQSVAFQKETIALQLQEIEGALKELASAKGDVFRATGMILVKKDASALKKELEEQKEILTVRIGALGRQEKLIGDRLAAIQNKLIQSHSQAGMQKSQERRAE